MEAVKLLEKLVSIDSVFPHESELAHFLAGELERCGFEVRMQRFGENGDRYNVLAERGRPSNHSKPLLLYGHMDTVPPYGYGKGSDGRDPFRLEERDGKLFGLGSYDMKAGVAAIIEAVRTSGNVQNGRPVKIMFVSDEEADSQGCYAATKTDFMHDVRFAISAEMSDVGDIADKTRTITLGRRGRVQYEVLVPGRSIHAARMGQGISAVTEAAKLALEIERMNPGLPRHEKLSRGDQFVRSFHSQSVSLSIPDEARLLVDRHLVFPESAESARQDIERKIGELYAAGAMREADGRRATVQVKPRDVPYLMPYVIEEDNLEVARLADAVHRTLGAEPRYNYGLTVADENLIAMQGIPVVTYGPIGGGEHSGNEWVSKKSYHELIDVLGLFLSNK